MDKSSRLWWAAPGLLLPFLSTFFSGALFTGLLRCLTVANGCRGLPWWKWVLGGASTATALATGVALFLLCRDAWPSFRRGWRAWLLLPAMVLAGVMTALWPFVLFAPAARRLGGRRACAYAVAAGVVLVAMYAGLLVMTQRELAFILDAAFRPWNASPLPDSLWWFCQGCAPAGALLVHAALCRFHGKPRAFARVWGILLVLLLAAAVATQPAFRVPALRRERAALLARLVESSGSAIRPGAPLPAATPPVAPADDPIAAFDTAAMDRQCGALGTFIREFGARRPAATPGFRSSSRPVRRLHPLSAPEAETLENLLADSPDLAAAAEAFAAPGYRSSRQGVTHAGIPAEDGSEWVEPEVRRSFFYPALFAARAALAGFRGDADAARADLDGLRRCAAVYAREPTAYGVQLSCLALRLAWETGALQARLDLRPADGLESAVRDADAFADACETLWSDTFAADLAFRFRDGAPPNNSVVFDRLEKALSFLPPSYRAYWHESDKVAWLRHAESYVPDARAMLALPPGPERAAAFEGICARFEYGPENTLPLGADAFEGLSIPVWRHLELLTWPRDHASVLRTAAAVERYRRDRGSLPPDLGALVPGYLPSVPVGTESGKPIVYTPGPIDLPEETVPSSSRAPEPSEPADPSFVLPAETLPGFLLDLPGFAPTPLFFPTPGI